MPSYRKAQYSERRRGVSFPVALTLDEAGNEVPVFAKQFDDGNRPSETQQFHCPSCGEKMHLNAGQLKRNQPDPNIKGRLFDPSVKPLRGKPFFYHGKGTLIKHLETEAATIAFDLAAYIYSIGEKNGWDPQLEKGTLKRAWVVRLTSKTDSGEDISIPFIISPTPQQWSAKIENGVLLTSTTGKGGDRDRLILYDSKGNPLSAQRLLDFITSDKMSNVEVSGYFTADTFDSLAVPKEFTSKHLSLAAVVRGLMRGQYKFVSGADLIPDYILPTRARNILIDSNMESGFLALRNRYNFVQVSRDLASDLCATLGLVRYKDDVEDPSTHRFTWGKAEILYLPTNMVDNPTGRWRQGDPRIIIAPDVESLPDQIYFSDWQNTLVLFLNDPKYASAFGRRVKEMVKAHNDEMMIISTFRSRVALEKASEFIEPNRQIIADREAALIVEQRESADEKLPDGFRRPAVDPDFDLDVFIAYETGMVRVLDRPLRPMPLDLADFDPN